MTLAKVAGEAAGSVALATDDSSAKLTANALENLIRGLLQQAARRVERDEGGMTAGTAGLRGQIPNLISDHDSTFVVAKPGRHSEAVAVAKRSRMTTATFNHDKFVAFPAGTRSERRRIADIQIASPQERRARELKVSVVVTVPDTPPRVHVVKRDIEFNRSFSVAGRHRQRPGVY